MAGNSFLERRNRALLAFAYLSGVRVGALITLQIKHVDLKLKAVDQLAAEVATKNSKTIRSDWFPVGEMFEAIVSDWITDLKAQGATGETPLFPRGARYTFGARNGSGWEPLKDEGTVAKIFARIAIDNGIDHFTPHRVRDTIGSMIFRWASNLEEAKALSQGFGHDNLKTTLDHYGAISEARQHELFSGIRDRSELQFGVNTRSLTPTARVQLQQTVEDFIEKMMSMLKTE
nr:site-specific integrase [Rhizobium cellulosilyticum]